MRLDHLADLNAEVAARRAVILVTELGSGEQRLVREDEVENDVLVQDLRGMLQQSKSGIVLWDGRQFFVTVQPPPTRMIIVGAVHISQALAPIAKKLDFDVTIIDPRTAFATPERFPDVPLMPKWPDVALPDLGIDRYTAVLALTHDPKIDDPALAVALRSSCFYIGALGSRKTHERRSQRLTALGFKEADLARIHAPIGLHIGAISPAEIAISIVAEIVATLRKEQKR
jgi:xanthine dehydrogenase accessory factor